MSKIQQQGSGSTKPPRNELLSICIPTYNHAEPLKKALDAMIPQAQQYNIPIYVSDNASTDHTVKALAEFQKRYPLLFFKSNTKNLGIDENMILASKMASSKYVWTIGARRIILPGMLTKIYKKLQESDWDMIILNDFNVTFKVPKTQRYDTAQRVFRELFRNLTGVGFQVLPLKAWNSDRLPLYDKTEWTIVGVCLDYLAYKNPVNVFFIAEPCATDSGRSHWKRKHFKIWTDLKTLVNSLPPTYSAEDKEFVLKNIANAMFIPKYSPIDLMFRSTLTDLRIQKLYNAEIFNAYRGDLQKYGGYPSTVAYVIAKFPIPLLKLYFDFYDGVRVIARRFIHRLGPLNPHSKPAAPY